MGYIILVEKQKIDIVITQLTNLKIEIINRFPLIGMLIVNHFHDMNIEEVGQKVDGIISIEEGKKNLKKTC